MLIPLLIVNPKTLLTPEILVGFSSWISNRRARARKRGDGNQSRNHHIHIPLYLISTSMTADIITRIRTELKSAADPAIRKTSQRFFKEEILCYGIKTAIVTAIARKFWIDIKSREKQDIFQLCEELYQSGMLEEAFIVSHWIPHLKKEFEPEDLAVFRSWIDTYISNWAACDSFCNHTMGDFIDKFPEYIDELKRWTQSDNRWMRRSAAVSLIVPAKHGKFLKEAMEIADLLLTDDDDLVQKGYGWLLKEASRKHPKEIFNFIMRNKTMMPRTALRYAIELLPKERKAEAMKRDWQSQRVR